MLLMTGFGLSSSPAFGLAWLVEPDRRPVASDRDARRAGV